MRITRLGRTAFYFYSVITVRTGCIPFFKWWQREDKKEASTTDNKVKDPFCPFSFLEILEYAEKIGIDVTNEPHLLYIAKEGVLQELPPQWKPW